MKLEHYELYEACDAADASTIFRIFREYFNLDDILSKMNLAPVSSPEELSISYVDGRFPFPVAQLTLYSCIKGADFIPRPYFEWSAKYGFSSQNVLDWNKPKHSLKIFKRN